MFSFLFDPINISLVITALLNFFLGALIFTGGRKKKINIVFSLNIAAVIGWTMAMFFFRSASQEFDLFWCTILYVTPTMIASSFLYFTYIFPSRKEKYIWWRTILIFGINLAIIVMVIWPGFVIKEVNIRPGQEKEIIFTQYYWFYFLYILLFFTFGFYRLFRKYFKTTGIERAQIIYLLSGYALSANSAFATNLIMPWIGLFFLNWLGQIFTLIGVTSTTYAILRYRLMDIRIVVRKVFVYFVMAGLVYGMFYLIAWLYSRVFGNVLARPGYVLGLIIAPLFVLLFYWLDKNIKNIVNRYFFFSLYNYQTTINNLSQKLNYLNDLDEIINLIVDTVKQTMQLDRAGILLIDKNKEEIKYKIAKVIGFNEKNGISLVQDNFLTKHLKRTRRPLVKEELTLLARYSQTEKERKGFLELESNMKRIEASLCLPLMSSKKLIGIIVLGSKVSGDTYTEEDLELLSTLAYQAGIAIDNARLYKEIQDFNKTLQEKVDEQTKEIREQKEEIEKAYEVEKKAREDLQKLDQQKTEFMLITQHHLRTPLTSMKGYIDLIESGAFGKVPKKLGEIIHRFGISSQNLIKIVNEFLDLSQFQLDQKVIMPKPNIDIIEILKNIVKDLSFEAEKKGIFLKLEAPKKDLPRIEADAGKLQTAIFNVVNNAIKYTEKGGVTVNIKYQKSNIKDNDKLQIIIKDTGIGMGKNELNSLFHNLLVRGEGAKKINVTGRGIGLYLSSKIIEAHQGRIWAESEGEGRGSTFYIELPVELSA